MPRRLEVEVEYRPRWWIMWLGVRIAYLFHVVGMPRFALWLLGSAVVPLAVWNRFFVGKRGLPLRNWHKSRWGVPWSVWVERKALRPK